MAGLSRKPTLRLGSAGVVVLVVVVFLLVVLVANMVVVGVVVTVVVGAVVDGVVNVVALVEVVDEGLETVVELVVRAVVDGCEIAVVLFADVVVLTLNGDAVVETVAVVVVSSNGVDGELMGWVVEPPPVAVGVVVFEDCPVMAVFVDVIEETGVVVGDGNVVIEVAAVWNVVVVLFGPTGFEVVEVVVVVVLVVVGGESTA